MKRIVVLLIISLFVISNTSVAQAKTYQNCYQLTGDFPYGVAQGFYRVGTSNASINRKIYTSNKKLDTDYDGIVCEVEILQNPPTTTTTSTTTTTIPITLKTPVADLAAFVKSQGSALTTIKCQSNSSVSTGSGTSIQATYTGSAASDKGIQSTLVTNHHVVKNCLRGDWLSRQVQVLTGSAECIGYVWGWDASKDLASVLTTCEVPKVSGFTGTVVPKPVIGDVGIIIGSAAGIAGTSTQGAIANITDNEILTTAQAAPGSSGGALFNRNGQLLGIVQAGTGSLTVVIPITKFVGTVYHESVTLAWNSAATISTSTIPSSTATTTATTTTTTTSSTTTIPPTTTTTTLAVSPLTVGVPSPRIPSSSVGTFGISFTTDSSALPEKVCWTVTVDGSRVENLKFSALYVSNPDWRDAGGGCAAYSGTSRDWQNRYFVYVQFDYRGTSASWDPMPYQTRSWSARATVYDTLGRSITSSDSAPESL